MSFRIVYSEKENWEHLGKIVEPWLEKDIADGAVLLVKKKRGEYSLWQHVGGSFVQSGYKELVVPNYGPLMQVLLKSGMAKTLSEARQLIREGWVKINGEKITDDRAEKG